MELEFESKYKKFSSSTIHEIFYFMKDLKNRNERVFHEYNQNLQLFNCAKNVVTIAKHQGEIKGFVWCNIVPFVNNERYFNYSYYLAPEARKHYSYLTVSRKDGCPFAKNTITHLQDLYNSKEHSIKGISVISMNRKISQKILESYGHFSYLGKNLQNFNIGYYNFDGSIIKNEDFNDWIEKNDQ